VREKRIDPTAKTYYLDTSTLSHARNAAAGAPGVPTKFAQVVPWIEGVATKANLCLSFVHVGECSD